MNNERGMTGRLRQGAEDRPEIRRRTQSIMARTDTDCKPVRRGWFYTPGL